MCVLREGSGQEGHSGVALGSTHSVGPSGTLTVSPSGAGSLVRHSAQDVSEVQPPPQPGQSF